MHRFGSCLTAAALALLATTIAVPAHAATASGSCGGDVPTSVTHDPANQPPVLTADTLSVREGDTGQISPLANDSDPEGQPLTIVAISCGGNGFASVADGIITYMPVLVGTETYTVAVTDGQHYVTTTLTVTVVDVPSAKASIISKNGRSAIVKFTNPNKRPIQVLVGSFARPEPDDVLVLKPGQSARYVTTRDRLDYITLIETPVGPAFIGTDRLRIREKYSLDSKLKSRWTLS